MSFDAEMFGGPMDGRRLTIPYRGVDYPDPVLRVSLVPLDVDATTLQAEYRLASHQGGKWLYRYQGQA